MGIKMNLTTLLRKVNRRIIMWPGKRDKGRRTRFIKDRLGTGNQRRWSEIRWLKGWESSLTVTVARSSSSLNLGPGIVFLTFKGLIR